MEDNDLIALAKVAVIWGQIVFHLDGIILGLMGQRNAEKLAKYPTKSMKTKLTDLSPELSKPEHQKVHEHLLLGMQNDPRSCRSARLARRAD